MQDARDNFIYTVANYSFQRFNKAVWWDTNTQPTGCF